ncbi:hypothetical protein PAP_07720 [Palaeococcus pacificus DY20341]|uniref:NurA domain-containing protein n=1 Tax=Palaeococcus pacificus DY20341 TaxID=1343739 RepID=A0A075LZD5_9EURY|nr:DNA double-strand break repair nuclease NurA [Palaeococcus pacificus]AIF69933.1 hypothetical protein PAP_07720 [Palaeococcus pacificus DY20341]
MPRISESHLKEVRKYLDSQLDKIKLLKELVAKEYRWQDFPQPKKVNVYAVDGSRMIKRLSGAIVYAVSSVAIGKDLLQWHEIGLVSPYKHVDERIRLHMQTLENRIGAMTREIKGAELILMDGTLSGSIARPPAYVDTTIKEIYKENKIEMMDLVRAFLDMLDDEWTQWKKDLEAEGLINYSTVIARKNDIFDLIKERSLDAEFVDGIKENPSYSEDVIIFLEYLEYLHSLDRLFAGNVASIAKTFYTDDLVKSAIEKQSANGTGDNRTTKNKPAPMLDVPIIDAISKERGYIRFNYSKSRKWSLPEVIKEVAEKHGHLKNIVSLFSEREIYERGKIKKVTVLNIQPFYVRFVNGGVIYLLEIPKLGKNKELEMLSYLLSAAEDEYVIPLEYAHHTVVIKKQEFDTYVDSLISALVGEDEKYLSFLRYGREPLE